MSHIVLADYPAYTIIETPAYLTFKHGMKFAIPFQSQRHGTLWHFFTLGSVFGYAVHNGDDVLKNYERAVERGHKLWWANADAVVISNQKEEKKTIFGQNYGDVIKFEGKLFRLDKAPNNNVALVQVGEEG